MLALIDARGLLAEGVEPGHRLLRLLDVQALVSDKLFRHRFEGVKMILTIRLNILN